MEMETVADDSGEVPGAGKIVRRTEFFWLCDTCASEMTLEYDAKGSVLVKPVASDFRAAS